MVNHDVDHQKRSAAVAAFNAILTVDLQKAVFIPDAAKALITEIAQRHGMIDALEISGKVIMPNLAYWRSFGRLRWLMRKIGIGVHPFRSPTDSSGSLS